MSEDKDNDSMSDAFNEFFKPVRESLYNQLDSVVAFRLVKDIDGYMAAMLDKNGDVVGYTHPDNAISEAKKKSLKIYFYKDANNKQ